MKNLTLEKFIAIVNEVGRLAGVVALEMQPTIQNIGKTAEIPSGSESDAVAKSQREALTIVDSIIQELILTGVQRHFPEISGVIAEEKTKSLAGFNLKKNCRLRLVFDPLDGTLAYTQQKDGWGILVGLLEDDKFIGAVLVYPKADAVYSALERGGALIGNISTTTTKRFATLANAPAIIEINSRVDIKMREAWTSKGFEVRVVDDAATAIIRVFEGRTLGYCCQGRQLHDIGPAGFVAEQAGCHVSDWHGNPIKYPYLEPARIPEFLVCGRRHEQILDAIK